MSPYYPIIIDTETTGLEKGKDSIVQLAAVLLGTADGLRATSTIFSTLCNPGMSISEDAGAIHGITEEDVQWSAPARHSLWVLSMILHGYAENGPVVLCGQNQIAFDIPFMDAIYPEGNFPKYPAVDTYTIALREFPDKPHKLGEFYEWYVGKPAIKAHDAAADCHMCGEILLKYMAESGKRIEQIAEEQKTPQLMSVFPWGKHKGKPIGEVPRSYLEWCRKNFDTVHPDVGATICHQLECDPWPI